MTKNSKIAIKQQEVNQRDLSTREIYTQFFSGPIPPPEDLEKYEAIRPGFAEEFLIMAKKEQDFRHTEISRVNKHDIFSGYLGMFLAFLIFIFAGVLIYFGKNIGAAILIVPAVLPFARLFIKGKSNKEDEKIDK